MTDDEEPMCPYCLVPLRGGTCWNMDCHEPDKPIHPIDKWEGVVEFVRGVHEERERLERKAKKP